MKSKHRYLIIVGVLCAVVLVSLLASTITGHAAVNLKDGLVAYYPLDGNANDASENGRHGTIFGATPVDPVDAKIGSALSFDSNYPTDTDYVRLPNDTVANLGSFSVAMWINPNPAASTNARWISLYNSDSEGFAGGLQTTGNGIFFKVNRDGGGSKVTDGYSVPADWIHVVWVSDNYHKAIYVNGSEKNMTGGSIGAGSVFSAIGAANMPNRWTADGEIDEVYIYDRVLEDEEIIALYNAECGIDAHCPGEDECVNGQCETACADADGDEVCDGVDNCPAVVNRGQENNDADSLGDACDNCPTNSTANQDNSDDDYLGDVCDNCPLDDNALQSDGDGDLVGDTCDNCPADDNAEQTDSDGDLVGDTCDNCPDDPNLHQLDNDTNGIGDACEEVVIADADADEDGIIDSVDNCPLIANTDQVDTDTDAIGDVCDNCPAVSNVNQVDADSDGVGDACEAEAKGPDPDTTTTTTTTTADTTTTTTADTTTTTADPDPDPTPDEEGWPTKWYVLAGAGGFIFIILLIVIIWVTSRRREPEMPTDYYDAALPPPPAQYPAVEEPTSVPPAAPAPAAAKSAPTVKSKPVSATPVSKLASTIAKPASPATLALGMKELESAAARLRAKKSAVKPSSKKARKKTAAKSPHKKLARRTPKRPTIKPARKKPTIKRARKKTIIKPSGPL